MNKLPAFQFYPSDWRSDPGIQSLSFEDRGIWFEILCLMHESPERGVLLLPNGHAMTSVSLARILGIPTPKMIKALNRIAEAGVSDRHEGHGALINRRMVRDELLLQKRREWGELGLEHGSKGAEHGKKGGRPQKNNPHETPLTDSGKPPLKPPPSSSSSSSEEGELRREGNGERSRKTRAPAELPISESMRAWAAENKILADLESETQHMLDHFRGKGETRLDWIATWRTWMRNSKKFTGGNGNGNHPKSRQDITRENAESLIRDIENQRGIQRRPEQRDAGHLPE